MTFCTQNSQDVNNDSQAKGLKTTLGLITAGGAAATAGTILAQTGAKQPVVGSGANLPSTSVKSPLPTASVSVNGSTLGTSVYGNSSIKLGYIQRSVNPCISPYCFDGALKENVRGSNNKTESFMNYPITQKDKDICDGKVASATKSGVQSSFSGTSKWNDFVACIPKLNVPHVYSCYVRMCLMKRTLDQISPGEETVDKPLSQLKTPFISSSKDPELGMYDGCINPTEYKKCRNDYDIVTCNSNFCFGNTP